VVTLRLVRDEAAALTAAGRHEYAVLIYHTNPTEWDGYSGINWFSDRRSELAVVCNVL
jgi:hypothetical protein